MPWGWSARKLGRPRGRDTPGGATRRDRVVWPFEYPESFPGPRGFGLAASHLHDHTCLRASCTSKRAVITRLVADTQLRRATLRESARTTQGGAAMVLRVRPTLTVYRGDR